MGNKIWRELHNSSPKEAPEREEEKTAVIAYIRGVTHRLKRVLGRAGVRLVFSAPNKLGKMCARVNDVAPSRGNCGKMARSTCDPAQSAQLHLLYLIPLSCGRQYVGHTGSCLNIRLMEHASSVRAGSGGWLSAHVSSCKCCPEFERCQVIIKHCRDQCTRELLYLFRGKKNVHKERRKKSLNPYLLLYNGIFWHSHCKLTTISYE